MRMPSSLRKLDDRVLGSKGSARDDQPRDAEHRDADHDADRQEGSSRGDAERTRTVERTEERTTSRGNGDGLQKVLATVWRISRLVLIALALLMVLAIAFLILPANEDNVIVSNVLDWADTVAGPFRDVFNADDEDRRRIYNYGLAAVVYFVIGSIVGKLPTGSKKAG